MFIVSEMRNVVRITPDLFHLNLRDAVTIELNKKLANKVSIQWIKTTLFDYYGCFYIVYCVFRLF